LRIIIKKDKERILFVGKISFAKIRKGKLGKVQMVSYSEWYEFMTLSFVEAI